MNIISLEKTKSAQSSFHCGNMNDFGAPVRFFLFLVLLAPFVSCSESVIPGSNNYAVLISIDCINQRELIKYTRDTPVMPNLAELMADSVMFTQGHSHAPWTLPAHMSMLTGLYPYQLGRDVPFFFLKESEDSSALPLPTMPRLTVTRPPPSLDREVSPASTAMVRVSRYTKSLPVLPGEEVTLTPRFPCPKLSSGSK